MGDLEIISRYSGWEDRKRRFQNTARETSLRIGHWN